MITVAIANQKGGVGKTTTATNLAAGLAERNFRTLLVDLDSQCNTTMTYLDPQALSDTLPDVLVGTNLKPMDEVIYSTSYPNLDVAPSNIRLAMIDRMVAIEEQYRLRNALNSVAHDYDVVIIDCPPSLGMSLTAALLASTHVIIPVAATYYPVEGVVDLASTINAARQPNPQLQLLGVLLTDFDARTNIAAEAQSKIQQMFPGIVFETVIRSNVKLQTAPSYKQSIYEHAPASQGARDYAAFVDEVVDRLKLGSRLRVIEAKEA
jgi:chromosome partitioning protein